MVRFCQVFWEIIKSLTRENYAKLKGLSIQVNMTGKKCFINGNIF